MNQEPWCVIIIIIIIITIIIIIIIIIITYIPCAANIFNLPTSLLFYLSSLSSSSSSSSLSSSSSSYHHHHLSYCTTFPWLPLNKRENMPEVQQILICILKTTPFRCHLCANKSNLENLRRLAQFDTRYQFEGHGTTLGIKQCSKYQHIRV